MKTLVLLCIIVTAVPCWAVPQLINYQGYLASADGAALDTVISVTFRFYDALSGGYQLWSETHDSCVVESGVFTVQLGSVMPLPDIFSQDAWLGIRVGSDPPMTPRQQVCSVANAYRVGTIDGATGGNVSGTIQMDTLLETQGIRFDDGSVQFTAADTSGLATRNWVQSLGYLRGTGNEASEWGFVGGGNFNKARGYSSVVAGGGSEMIDDSNSAVADWSVISGGKGNFVNGFEAVIGGGSYNTIQGFDGISVNARHSTIGGGTYNRIEAPTATISGGNANLATEDGATGTISGGSYNVVSAPSAVVCGGYFNRALGEGSFVGGGGCSMMPNDSNAAIGNFSTIVGGQRNTAAGDRSFIGGGFNNRADSIQSTIAGGANNEAAGRASVIAGGGSNLASGWASAIGGGTGNVASGTAATVGGGDVNLASGHASVVCGGELNRARGMHSAVVGGGGLSVSDSNAAIGNCSFVGGGSHNYAIGDTSVVCGGQYNTAVGLSSTVSGGEFNGALGHLSMVGGGTNNSAQGDQATISGGGQNAASGEYATVGGGFGNGAWASYSTIPGGMSNEANGVAATAMGSRAKAYHDGSFVWADHTDLDFWSTANNQFSLRATGGVHIFTNLTLTSGMTMAAGGSGWVAWSDSTKKQNIRLVDTKNVLDKVSQLPIKQWSYKSQDPSIEHIGPMAQDFWNKFHLGEDSLGINQIDPDGVALAAIQELAKRNEKLEIRNEKLEAEMALLRAQVQTLLAGETKALKEGN